MTRITTSGLLLCLLLGACGQSGPLYLPGNPSEVEVEVPATGAASDEGQEDDSEDEENETRG